MSRFQVGGGALIVRAKGGSYADSSPLTVQARDESYSVQVVAKTDGQSRAALALQYHPDVALVAESKTGQLNVYGSQGQLATHGWQGDTAWLKLVNRKNHVEVLASRDAKKWQSLQKNFDVSSFNDNDQHGGYQAARSALAAIGDGLVRFTDFRYQNL